jgi:Fe-S-cluster containining protein
MSDVDALHREVDALAHEIASRHGARLKCARGCASCCVDELTVYEVEAERIRRHSPELLAEGRPHAAGACAMLDERGACRVYEARPYVCRTQGLPLRWFEEDEHDEIVEERDICPLNLEGPTLPSLPDQDCWLIGPFEERLAELQARADGGAMKRVALRGLFASS